MFNHVPDMFIALYNYVDYSSHWMLCLQNFKSMSTNISDIRYGLIKSRIAYYFLFWYYLVRTRFELETLYFDINVYVFYANTNSFLNFITLHVPTNKHICPPQFPPNTT